MAKLSDEELLNKYDDLESFDSWDGAMYSKLRAEILKRMGKVDVAGIAREIQAAGFCSSNPVSAAYEYGMTGAAVEYEELVNILRSYLEGKSE